MEGILGPSPHVSRVFRTRVGSPALLGIALVLLGMFLLSGLPQSASAEQIDTVEIWKGHHTLNESLTILQGGTLIIRDATITVNGPPGELVRLTISEGGTLRIERSTISSVNDSRLIVVSDGSLRISDSLIDGLGGVVEGEGGINIRADPARIERSTVRNATWAAIVFDGGSPRVTDSNISDASIGILQRADLTSRIERVNVRQIERQGLNLRGGHGFVREVTIDRADIGIGLFQASPRVQQITMHHVRVGIDVAQSDLFGVSDLDIEASVVALRQQEGSVSLSDSTLRSDLNGINVTGGILTIRDSTVRGAIHGISMDEGTLIHTGGSIRGEVGYGLRVHGGVPTYEVASIEGGIHDVGALYALLVRVEDFDGGAAPNVTVELHEVDSALLWTVQSDEQGRAGGGEVLQWYDDGAGAVSRTPHTVKVVAGHRKASQQVTLNSDVEVTVTLPRAIDGSPGLDLPQPATTIILVIAAGAIAVLAIRAWWSAKVLALEDSRRRKVSKHHGRKARVRGQHGGRTSAHRRPQSRPGRRSP